MKKRLLLLLFVFITPFFVDASPVTYTRSRTELRVPDDVLFSNPKVEDILKIPSVDEKSKIYDFADLLTDAEETQVYIQLNEFINNTGLDAAIVTTNDLHDFQMNEYTYHFYDYNFFKDDGIAFVIYKNKDAVSIFMGNNGPKTGPVFEAYTDNRIKEILKYVYENHIRSGDYVGACEDYVKLVNGFYVKTFGNKKVGEEDVDVPEDSSISWTAVFIISLALSFIIVSLTFTKFKKTVRYVDQTVKKALNTNSMVVKCEYDKPVNVKKTGNE